MTDIDYSILAGPLYVLPGRTIANGAGVPLVACHRIGNDSAGYTVAPREADELTRRLVAQANAAAELAEALRVAVEAMETARCGAEVILVAIDAARAALAKAGL